MKIKFENFISKIILILKRPDMNILPGHLAFFFVLSLIPLLTLITFFATLLNIPVEITNAVHDLPNSVLQILVPASTDTSITLTNIIIILVSFFLASNGADAVIVISNKLYNINKSSILERKIKAIIVTMIFIGLFLFMLLIPVFGDIIIDTLSHIASKNVFIFIKGVYSVLQIPVSLLVIYINIKIIYTISPDMNVRSSEVTRGALFTTIGWVLVSKIYSYYVNNIANYDRIYGNLSNLVILMLFIFLLSFIFVIGMAFNAYKNELDDEINKTGRINIIKSIHNM